MGSSELPGLNGAVDTDAWAALVRDLSGRYLLHLERKDSQSELRYVAVALSLDVRPYAVVTTDLDELRRALGQRDTQPCTSGTQPPRSDEAERGDGPAPLATPGGSISPLPAR